MSVLTQSTTERAGHDRLLRRLATLNTFGAAMAGCNPDQDRIASNQSHSAGDLLRAIADWRRQIRGMQTEYLYESKYGGLR